LKYGVAKKGLHFVNREGHDKAEVKLVNSWKQIPLLIDVIRRKRGRGS